MSKLVVEVSKECLVQLKHVALDKDVKPVDVAAEILEKFATKKKSGKAIGLELEAHVGSWGKSWSSSPYVSIRWSSSSIFTCIASRVGVAITAE